MSQYLKPRRGKYTSAETQNIVLKKGEMFLCMVNNDDMGRGTGAVYIGDGGTEFNDYAHNGSTTSNVPQPFLVHPANYKPIFANTNPSTASYQIDPAVSDINDIGTGKANKVLPEIIGKIKSALCKHADSINKLSSDTGNIEDTLDQQSELLNTLSTEFANMKSRLDKMYPVGSLYLAADHTVDPATFLPGRWQRFSANYVLKTIVEGDSATQGVGNTGSTTLNINQIPSHTHKYGKAFSVNTVDSDGGGISTHVYDATNDEATTVPAGGGQGHTHTAGMPANIGVHVWKRIS